MNDLFFDKTPGESFYFTLDFSKRLADGETISGFSIVVTSRNGSTLNIVAASEIKDTGVDVKVEKGLVDEDFKITIDITTSLGNVIQDYVTMHVV